jgi:hypothetical protein
MSKIFLDGFFSSYFEGTHHIPIDYCQFNKTNWLQKLPDDCDLVAISFYTNLFHQYLWIIDYILPRTKKLYINISEPTDSSVLDYINCTASEKITIFTDIVTNLPQYDNKFKTKVSWFIGSMNYYRNNDYCTEILSRVLIPRSWQPRSKIFDCLLGRQAEHRNFIEKLYNNCNFKEKFIYNYYKDDVSKGIWDKNTSDNNNINLRLSDNTIISKFAVLPYEIYNDSYISIVAETTTFNSFSQFTEKIAKPILARRPFVVFCGQYYLRNLRKLGFMTFGDIKDEFGHPVIDESYDTIEDNRQRWTAAWHQIEKIKNADFDLLHAQVQRVLDHNLSHFLCTDWHKEIRIEFEKDLKLL